MPSPTPLVVKNGSKARATVSLSRTATGRAYLLGLSSEERGAYLQNLDLTGPVSVPYSPDVRFGFLDLDDLGVAAAIVLTVRPLRPARPASRHPGARITAAVIDRHVQGWDMVSNPGSDRLQAPWDPDAKKKYIDTTYFWWLLPMMVVLVVLMVLFVGR